MPHRPAVVLSGADSSVYLKPSDRYALGTRPGRRSRRREPRDSYELDDHPFWVMVAQRIKASPLERLVLEHLAARGAVRLYSREADLEQRLRRAQYR
jgi:hypothetical protein